MTTEIDKSAFSVNERPREYQVTFKVEGEVRVTIKADSHEEARAKAAAMNDDDFANLDEVVDVEIEHVRKSPPMYRITRDGRSMQVSKIEPGDLPREPDERGF